MSEPVYFAVIRSHGRESPRRFFESIPKCYLTKDRRGELVYWRRLDTLPNADAMINAPLDELMRLYRALQRAGKLPIN